MVHKNDKPKEKKVTALEIKTGRHKNLGHRT